MSFVDIISSAASAAFHLYHELHETQPVQAPQVQTTTTQVQTDDKHGTHLTAQVDGVTNPGDSLPAFKLDRASMSFTSSGITRCDTFNISDDATSEDGYKRGFEITSGSGTKTNLFVDDSGGLHLKGSDSEVKLVGGIRGTMSDLQGNVVSSSDHATLTVGNRTFNVVATQGSNGVKQLTLADGSKGTQFSMSDTTKSTEGGYHGYNTSVTSTDIPYVAPSADPKTKITPQNIFGAEPHQGVVMHAEMRVESKRIK